MNEKSEAKKVRDVLILGAILLLFLIWKYSSIPLVYIQNEKYDFVYATVTEEVKKSSFYDKGIIDINQETISLSDWEKEGSRVKIAVDKDSGELKRVYPPMNYTDFVSIAALFFAIFIFIKRKELIEYDEKNDSSDI